MDPDVALLCEHSALLRELNSPHGTFEPPTSSSLDAIAALVSRPVDILRRLLAVMAFVPCDRSVDLFVDTASHRRAQEALGVHACAVRESAELLQMSSHAMAHLRDCFLTAKAGKTLLCPCPDCTRLTTTAIRGWKDAVTAPLGEIDWTRYLPPRPPLTLSTPSPAVCVMLGISTDFQETAETAVDVRDWSRLDEDAVLAAVIFRPELLAALDVKLSYRVVAVLLLCGRLDAASRQVRLRSPMFQLRQSDCRHLTALGRLDVLRWARDEGVWGLPMQDTCREAAEAGRTDIVEWACEHGARLSPAVCSAAHHGHLHIVEWAHARGEDVRGALMFAGLSGHRHILRWAHAQGLSPASGW
jgi:hypothetical protein